MTKPSKPPVWQLPALIGGAVVAFGAVGTGVVKLAQFLTVTDRVEAAEQKNVEQDSAIDKLTGIQETWQQIYQQQVQQMPMNAPVSRGLREWDGTTETFWCCPLANRDDCYEAEAWYRCP